MAATDNFSFRLSNIQKKNLLELKIIIGNPQLITQITLYSPLVCPLVEKYL